MEQCDTAMIVLCVITSDDDDDDDDRPAGQTTGARTSIVKQSYLHYSLLTSSRNVYKYTVRSCHGCISSDKFERSSVLS